MQNQGLFLFLNTVALSPIALLFARALGKGLCREKHAAGMFFLQTSGVPETDFDAKSKSVSIFKHGRSIANRPSLRSGSWEGTQACPGS
jgi:hypothetical protein